MKKVLLSLIASFAIFSAFSQPCVQSYSTGNLGGGDCPTSGTGNNKYYPGYTPLSPAAQGYTPTGKITVFFKTAIPAGIAAPVILAAGVDDGNGNMTQPPFDYKYAPYNDNASVSRVSVVYCYYGSASNQNIFNGSKAPKLVFQIQYYPTTSAQNCGGVVGQGTLPVNFKSFTASKANITNTLKWSTSFESNSKGFYVQRFYSGKWENVSFVPSKADGGLSNTDLNYSYNDVFSFKGAVQYRIQQVDFDGQTKLSQICSLVNGTTGNVLIYPNPGVANGVISIVLPDASSTYGIQILDNTGRMIKEFTSVRNTQQVSNLARGQYIARIKDDNGQAMVEKFIVQ